MGPSGRDSSRVLLVVLAHAAGMVKDEQLPHNWQKFCPAGT
jgi:hypothetical protein